MRLNQLRVSEQVCAVPFRIRGGRAEFCLIARNGEGRWEFPRGKVSNGEANRDTALRHAADVAGLLCEIDQDNPLDQFPASKVDDAETITAFLVRVEVEQENWPASGHSRRRWCFPEEAKVRIRRKPMRRLVDLAVRQIKGTEE